MLLRLLLGLVLGLVIGGVVAAGLVMGLHVLTFSGAGGVAFAYLSAAVTGGLTGLIAGKPIWSQGAKVEAGLKAVFGLLIGAGLMFAIRRWVGTVPLDLPQIGVDSRTPVGDLPAASLPMLAAVLGAFFGLDNTGTDTTESSSKARPAQKGARVAADGANEAGARRREAARADLDEEADVVSKRANR